MIPAARVPFVGEAACDHPTLGACIHARAPPIPLFVAIGYQVRTVGESTVFEWLSAALEQRAPLTRLEARGTVRLVLKGAGLEPASVRANQMQVVLERMMPAALTRRGVEDAEDLCRELATELRERGPQLPDADAETPYDVFERLDNDAIKRPKR